MIHTGFNNEINRLILPSNLVHFIVQFNSYHGLKCLILYHDYFISIIRLHPLYISFSHDVINSSYDFPQIYQSTCLWINIISTKIILIVFLHSHLLMQIFMFNLF